MAGSGCLNVNVCSAHPNAYLVDDYHAGKMVCPECDLEVDYKVIDVSAEWETLTTTYTETSPNVSYVGSPTDTFLANCTSLFTNIGKIPKSNQSVVKGRQKYSKHKHTIEDRLKLAVNSMKLMAERINLADAIVDRGKNLLCQIVKTHKLRLTEDCISACLYLACREVGAPRSFREIASISKSSLKDISRKYRSIVKLLCSNIKTVDPSEYMARFCACLSVPMPVQRTAEHIARSAAKLEIVLNRSPLTIAAASIYLASAAFDNVLRFKHISSVLGVSENAIREVYKIYRPVVVDLFPEDFQFAKRVCEFPE